MLPLKQRHPVEIVEEFKLRIASIIHAKAEDPCSATTEAAKAGDSAES